MSTNFYLLRKAPRDKKDEIISEIVNDNLECALQLLEDEVKETQIHLGKRSTGWQFLWYLNNEKYFKPNLESIKSFIAAELEKGAVIVDEYGQEFTLDKFINEEIGNSLLKGKYIDDDYYYYPGRNWLGVEKEMAHKYKVSPIGNFISEDGLKFCIDEFS